VAFLEFFLAAAWARVVAAYIFQRVTHRFCMAVTTAGAVYVALLLGVFMLGGVVVLAIWTVNVGFLLHGAYSGM
jgi:hypothetical protein